MQQTHEISRRLTALQAGIKAAWTLGDENLAAKLIQAHEDAVRDLADIAKFRESDVVR